MATPLAKIGILSIGDMGMGIAKLLTAHRFSVATNGSGRSNDTIERARNAQVELLTSDVDLVRACPVILSVVPPRDAVATAQRIADASRAVHRAGAETAALPPLYFVDLNAVAPSTTRGIAALFKEVPDVRFVDGCIIGAPPSASKGSAGVEAEAEAKWTVPSVPTSGPHSLSDIPDYGPRLHEVLNIRHIGPAIGSASGLKMCFASTSKGLTAIAIQAFTTAQQLGVLGELRQELSSSRAPAAGLLAAAERGLVGMPPKAYRWVREMEEIARTFAEDGGFAAHPSMFAGAAEVYRAVAEDTVLGRERVGDRKRGRDPADVAEAVAEGLREKRRKEGDVVEGAGD